MKGYFRPVVLVPCLVLIFGLLSIHDPGKGSYVVQKNWPIAARKCPQLSCAIVTTYAPGQVVEVLETVEGDTVFENKQWHHLQFKGVDVYIHSSQVALVSSDLPNANTPLSTTGWVLYEHSGMTIKIPRNWANVSGDETFLRYLMTIDYMDSDADDDVVYTNLSNYLFFMEYDARLSIGVQLHSYVFDESLTTLMNYMNDPDEESYEIFESAIEELAFGKALRMHYAHQNNESLGLTGETIEYWFFQDHVLFDLFINSENDLSISAVQLFNTVVRTFKVTDASSTRHALAAPAGDAVMGRNSARMKLAQNHFWFYEGEEAEEISLHLISFDAALDSSFARLVVWTPGGEVLARAEGYLSLDEPQLALVLPESGKYEIEVYLFGEYQVADYQLVLTSGSELIPNTQL